MPNNVLLSGPAGGGKSSLLQVFFEGEGPLTVGVDFQALYGALTGAVRNAAGRYPLREAALVPLVDQIRLFAIREAVAGGHRVIATNSSGSPVRRQLLMDLLSAGGAVAEERVVDPGREVVEARLSDPATGELSPECEQAIARFYSPAGALKFDVTGRFPQPGRGRRRR